MKILILADSHGFWETIYKIALREKPNVILHAGDGQGALERLAALLAEDLPHCVLHGVRGNCDRDDRVTPTNLLVELGGLRIYMIHGHLFPELRFGLLTNAAAFAKKQGADLLVYGHSHVQKDTVAGDLRCVNPGAAYQDRYAVLVIGADGALELRLM